MKALTILKVLTAFILIIGACWVAWGTWSILRPNSALLRKGTYNSNVDKWTYSAFIGCFITLFIVIYFPAFWLLSLVIPDQWGSYTDDGNWMSHAETIAVLIAGISPFWLFERMQKTGRSIVQIDYWTSRFQPKEVAQCIAELESIKPLFANVLFADSVLSRVKSKLVSADGREGLLRSIRVSGNKPRDVALQEIVIVSKSLMDSGQSHIYRGALDMEGSGILSVFNIALQELVKNGVINKAQASEQRSALSEAIKGIG